LVKQTPLKKQGRYQYGQLRVFINGYCKGDAYLNLVIRKHERVYLVVNIYEWGRWPRFTRRGGSMSLLVEIPKAALVRLAARLRKRPLRLRRARAAHWHEKYYPLEGS